MISGGTLRVAGRERHGSHACYACARHTQVSQRVANGKFSLRYTIVLRARLTAVIRCVCHVADVSFSLYTLDFLSRSSDFAVRWSWLMHRWALPIAVKRHAHGSAHGHMLRVVKNKIKKAVGARALVRRPSCSSSWRASCETRVRGEASERRGSAPAAADVR